MTGVKIADMDCRYNMGPVLPVVSVGPSGCGAVEGMLDNGSGWMVQKNRLAKRKIVASAVNKMVRLQQILLLTGFKGS